MVPLAIVAARKLDMHRASLEAPFIFRPSFVELAREQEHQPQAVVRHRVVRMPPQHITIQGFGFIQSPQFLEHARQVALPIRVLRRNCRRSPQCLNRFIQVTSLAQREAQIVVQVR